MKKTLDTAVLMPFTVPDFDMDFAGYAEMEIFCGGFLEALIACVEVFGLVSAVE